MKDKYGLAEDELDRIRERDENCVYCHKKMVNPCSNNCRFDWATIEHLNHLAPWNNPVTVAICCGSCNSSRGKRKLLDWFKTPYCIQENINGETVAEPVKEYIRLFENFADRLTWTFAKTMPEIPHYYIVRDNLAKEDHKTFDEFKLFIKKNGYTEDFHGKKYQYININKYKYWVIENILNREKIN